MKIRWLGHSCFLLTSQEGVKLITDPFKAESYLSYAPVTDAADIITASHGHWDHSYTDSITGKPEIIKGTAAVTVKCVEVTGFATFHDEKDGSERGENTIFRIRMDGLTVCHLGDLGHLLAAGLAADIGTIDVLLVPVGGVFTIGIAEAARLIGLLKPRMTIPMHYRNEHCQFVQWTVEDFIAGRKDVHMLDVDEVEVRLGSVPPGVTVLKYVG